MGSSQSREGRHLTPLELEIANRLSTQRQVTRNGQTLLNWGLIRDPDKVHTDQIAHAAVLMAQIYNVPLESQGTIAQELVRDNPDAAAYMWYEARATCHVEITKAIETGGSIVPHSFPDSMFKAADEYEVRRRQEIFDTPLDGKFAGVDQWLDEFKREGQGTQLLFKACVVGDVDVVTYLLSKDTPTHSQNDPSLVPLHAACANGNVECARVLCDEGLDVNEMDEFGGTPLMRAAIQDHIHVVKWLLENGADATLRETREPYYDALEYGAGKDVQTTRMLLDSGCEVALTALAIAANQGNEKSFDLLFSSGGYVLDTAQVDVRTDEKRSALNQVLSRSGPGGSLHILDSLLGYMVSHDAGSLTLPQPLEEFTVALHEAAQGAASFDHAAAMDKILKSITDNVKDEDNKEFVGHLLTLSATSASLATARLLIESYGANINYLGKPQLATALYFAVREGHIHMIRLLAEEYNANVHIASGNYANGPTPMWLAIYQQNEAVVRELLRLGGPVEYRDAAISTETKRVYISAARRYRAPVRLLAAIDPAWDETPTPDFQGTGERFLCLEYPDGFREDVKMRKTDDELKDERELRFA